MQLTQSSNFSNAVVSFVGANIEIGQSHFGLADSSNEFLDYLYQYKKDIFFEINFEMQAISRLSKEKTVQNFGLELKNEINFAPYQKLAKINEDLLRRGKIPFNFGGDHSIALATIEASLRYNTSTHIIWIDAHADANSFEESMTHAFHGMPVYYLLKCKKERPKFLNWMQSVLKPTQITYLGLRDLDPFEIKLLKELNIDYFTSEEMHQHGLTKIIQFLDRKNKLYDQIHLSFDIDSLDPAYGLCTGVPAIKGLHVDDINRIFQFVAATKKLVNFDLVEINPILAQDKNQLNLIYELAYQLAVIAFGGKMQFNHKNKEIRDVFISN